MRRPSLPPLSRKTPASAQSPSPFSPGLAGTKATPRRTASAPQQRETRRNAPRGPFPAKRLWDGLCPRWIRVSREGKTGPEPRTEARSPFSADQSPQNREGRVRESQPPGSRRHPPRNPPGCIPLSRAPPAAPRPDRLPGRLLKAPAQKSLARKPPRDRF